MTKKLDFGDENGVWRTIGGRRVFIKEGQDLATAMKESGKFNNKKKFSKREELKKDIARQVTQAEMNGNDAHAEAGKRELKRLIDEERLEKEARYKVDGKTISESDLKEEYKNELKRGNIEKDTTYNEWKKGIVNDKNSNVREKSGNDYLPKESKIETQGKSNRAEVSNNIQAHILSYYDNPVDFMEQMDNMDYYPTRWHAGQEMAKGGSYLIYNGDMSDFLNELKINPKSKKFSDDKSFQMYTSLIGRESERLYNRLEKLYNQYKAEHKNSDVSLDDFRKWFK